MPLFMSDEKGSSCVCSSRAPPRLMRRMVLSFTEAVIPSLAIMPANDTNVMMVVTTVNRTKANRQARVYLMNDFIVFSFFLCS